MKRTFLYALIASLSLGLFSCSNADEPMTPQTPAGVSDKSVNDDTKAIADLMTSIPLSEDIVNEVFSAVSAGLENGIEESYYFADVMAESSTKSATRSDNSGPNLGNELRRLLTSTRSSAGIDTDILEYGDYQIYWPYSEDWDGKTKPVITFVPEDDSQLWNYGYRQTEEGIETIIVDEEFMEKNPVWIINKADICYNDLPNFNNNEFSKNGVSYCPRTKLSNHEKTDNEPQTRSAGTPVYTVYLGKLMSEHQYDKVWSGGSEFAIRMGAIEHMDLTTEDQVKSENARINYVRVCRSRKDIKKRRWAELTGCVLSSDWQPSENNAAFSIYEEDQGGTKEYEVDLSVKILGKDIGFKLKMPFGSHDDKICKEIYSRNFMFSTNNSEGTIHSAGGVYWTMPYKVGYTVL